jgi:hypothetical protein
MSHIVTVQTRLRDAAAIAAACTRLGLPAPVQGTARLFSGSATGLLVQLPKWRYPVVIDTEQGVVSMDNYGGHWGKQSEFDHFLQAYAVEVAKGQARKKGYQVNETALQDGYIKLSIVEGTA